MLLLYYKGEKMFSRDDFDYINNISKSHFAIKQFNGHDISLHSLMTGHDWIIVTFYDRPNCILFHRHSSKHPYHRQHGNYHSLHHSIDYILSHEEWTLQKEEQRKKLSNIRKITHRPEYKHELATKQVHILHF